MPPGAERGHCKPFVDMGPEDFLEHCLMVASHMLMLGENVENLDAARALAGKDAGKRRCLGEVPRIGDRAGRRCILCG